MTVDQTLRRLAALLVALFFATALRCATWAFCWNLDMLAVVRWAKAGAAAGSTLIGFTLFAIFILASKD